MTYNGRTTKLNESAKLNNKQSSVEKQMMNQTERKKYYA